LKKFDKPTHREELRRLNFEKLSSRVPTSGPRVRTMKRRRTGRMKRYPAMASLNFLFTRNFLHTRATKLW
jgi:hypothetical protein